MLKSIISIKPINIINWIFQHVFRTNKSARFLVHFTSQVYNGENIVVVGGKTFKYLSNAAGCYFHGLNGIKIGYGTIIAPGVKIISTSHDKYDYTKLLFGQEYQITIGENCWLGANSIILPGVKLGPNTIVGAGSVVTKSFPEGNCTIVGVPGKSLKSRLAL